MTTKEELRQIIRQRKRQHTVYELSFEKERQEESQYVKDQLKENAFFADADTLLLYAALPDEVETQMIINWLINEGKTVILPKVIDEHKMELRRYTGSSNMKKGSFGIMEPNGNLYTSYNDIDVAIVPGMAFDVDGNRLGRGKGYYDRLLVKIPNTYKIGICFSWQLVDHVPTDEHDVRMNSIICKK